MPYSLLSRFQGAFAGSLIGESLVSDRQLPLLKEQPFGQWNQLKMNLTEQLLSQSQVTQNDWQALNSTFDNSSLLAFATLPLAVFFHDNLQQLREQLWRLKDLSTEAGSVWEDLLIWGDAIALILKEKVEIDSLLPQLQERHQATATNLWGQLEQVEYFLRQKTCLHQAVSQLSGKGKPSQTAIALAFYCFGMTPTDFRLSILRAQQSGYKTSVTTALTGILAGTYNSFSGIPISWRLLIKQEQKWQEISQKVNQLWAVWSGVYKPDNLEKLETVAVATTGILQPRQASKVISQQD